MEPSILFMGTSEFAVPSLEKLVQSNYSVAGVVTQPDRPQGRGRKYLPSPVKKTAERLHLPIYQPARVRDESFLAMFKDLAPSMVVLASFGQILPQEIIDGPPLGCINLHPSLLPKYRGAAPINWALINGDTKTGTSIIRMAQEVDAGDILLQKETPIDPDETFEELHDRLAEEGSDLLLEALNGIADGTLTPQPQDASQASYAPRLTKELAHIDWHNNVLAIVNLIRGLSPSPGAYSFLREKKLKIFSATAGNAVPGEKASGTIGRFMESGLQVTAGNGHVYLKEVQLEGKKRMFVDIFLRGFKLENDDILE